MMDIWQFGLGLNIWSDHHSADLSKQCSYLFEQEVVAGITGFSAIAVEHWLATFKVYNSC